ncbi:hypothetical protein DXG01_013927 [Tephrocybe rancida]|nr:hypothetical protein DXG01_013927 [Tephrocybe rancida]
MTFQADEETSLLQVQPIKKTPLPWAQFTIVMFLQLAEPLTFQVISPFAPQLIRDIGITNGNESQVGYYVGLLQSLFFLTQALTVLHWSRTSDFVGRKPVILIGLFGLSVSMYCFGFSRTFWGLVLRREYWRDEEYYGGIDRLDEYRTAWSTGGTFPHLFGNNEFLKKYPYFLPCAVPATFTAIAWLVTFLFLKETLKSPIPFSQLLKFRKDKLGLAAKRSTGPQDAQDKPLPLRALLTPRVIIASGNYAVLSLVDIAFRAIHPLFLSTPIALGGLGLPPPIIGNILSLYGICNGIIQVFFFARIHDRFGSKKTFVGGLACAVPCFIAFPIISQMAKAEGLSTLVWAAVVLQTLGSIGMRAIFIFIAAASPNRASLGATNGLSQMTVSMMRAIGPAAANSLFSLSIEKDLMSGYLVYYVLTAVVGVAIAPYRLHSTAQGRAEAKTSGRAGQEGARASKKTLDDDLREGKKQKERQQKREQEQAAIEAERQKRAEMERNSYQHSPKKAKADISFLIS